MNTVYLAVNKNDKSEIHSFTWDENDNLVINNVIVNIHDWYIVQFEESPSLIKTIK